MAFQESTGYCKMCNKQVMIRRKGTSHVLHFLLSCVTCGFWIPVWLLASVRFGGWRCTQCGRKTSRSLFS